MADWRSRTVRAGSGPSPSLLGGSSGSSSGGIDKILSGLGLGGNSGTGRGAIIPYNPLSRTTTTGTQTTGRGGGGTSQPTSSASASGGTWGNVAPPPGIPGAGGSSQQQAQANPFLTQMLPQYQAFQDRMAQQWNADPADMFAKLRANQSAMRNETIQQAGQRGGMGLTNAQLANMGRNEQMQMGQTAQDWKNMQLQNRNQIAQLMLGGLGGAAGVGGNIAANQLGQMQNLLGSQTLGLDAAKFQQMLPIEQMKAQNSGVAAVLGALGSLGGLSRLV